MKHSIFRELVAVLVVPLLVVLPLLALPTPAQAQDFYGVHGRILDGETVSGITTVADTDIALIVRHVGTAVSGTVEVSSGDVLLKVGAQASEAADTTVTRCGATDGTLSDADAECNTLGEMVDSINQSANWRAVIVDGLRSDLVSSAGLLTRSAVTASTMNGVPLYWDTSVALHTTKSMGTTKDALMPAYLDGTNLLPKPWIGRRFALLLWNATVTTGGAATMTVYSVDSTHSTTIGKATETVTTLYSTPGGASTAIQILDNADWGGYGIQGVKGQKMIVRVSATTSLTANVQYAFGYSYKYK